MARHAHHHVLRHRDRTPGPWANGGGVTYDVLRSPADVDAFDWRLSVAEVAADGPFSAYPGVDRTLVLLSGAMSLMVDGDAYDVPLLAPFEFGGEASVTSVLHGGPTMDFNVMTRRGRATADVRMLADSEVFLSPEPRAVTVIFVAQGTWRAEGVDEALSTWDCVVVDKPIALAGLGALAVVVLRTRTDSL